MVCLIHLKLPWRAKIFPLIKSNLPSWYVTNGIWGTESKKFWQISLKVTRNLSHPFCKQFYTYVLYLRVLYIWFYFCVWYAVSVEDHCLHMYSHVFQHHFWRPSPQNYFAMYLKYMHGGIHFSRHILLATLFSFTDLFDRLYTNFLVKSIILVL